MYPIEKPYRDEIYRSRKNLPSFSSTLLDEIDRSIDGDANKAKGFKGCKGKPAKRQDGSRAKTYASNSVEGEEVADFYLVQEWMGRIADEKIVAKGRPAVLPELENKSLPDNHDLLFFCSTSSSSDSSGALSSSDTEFFCSTTKPKVSCFSTRPKPVRTAVSPARKNNPREECSFFDEYKNHEKNPVESDLIKSKSRALKIYTNLKKMKQPISPGGRLTTFINSLFSNANGKKSINHDPNKGFQDSKSTKASSTSSSASSFSRSCLSKYSPKPRDRTRDGIQRTVRFHPLGVIVDEDSRPCGHTSIYDEDSDKYGKPPLPPNTLKAFKINKRDKNTRVEETRANALKGYYNQRGEDFSNAFTKIVHEDDEDIYDGDYIDDGASDSSSDLFELDHLALFGNSRFCEELPVYETTRFDKNGIVV